MSRFLDQSATLCDLCAGALALVVELQAGPGDAKNVESPKYEAVATRAREQLAALDRAARDHGFTKETVDQAKYAIVALLDEVVLASRWPMREEWLRRPLAAELFQEFNAGEEFFRRLENLGRGGRLDPQGLAVLEVFAICLSLGFRGMHTDVAGSERLREITYSTARRINESRENVPLAPHWEVRETVGSSVRRLPLWLILAGVVAVTLLLVGMLRYLEYLDVSKVAAQFTVK